MFSRSQKFSRAQRQLSGFVLTCDWFICLDLSKPFLTLVLVFQNYETSLAKQKQGIETDGYLRDPTIEDGFGVAEPHTSTLNSAAFQRQYQTHQTSQMEKKTLTN